MNKHPAQGGSRPAAMPELAGTFAATAGQASATVRPSATTAKHFAPTNQPENTSRVATRSTLSPSTTAIKRT